MVKGVSRQVILVQSPEPKLFEQAIFILKEEALKEGVTDEALLREAQDILRSGEGKYRIRKVWLHGAVGAAGGAFLTGLAWLLTVLF